VAERLALESGSLQVRRTLSEPKGGYVFEAPKSGKGCNVRLTRRAKAVLREHRMRQLEERMEHGALWQDYGLVFPSDIGTPLLGGNLNRAFKAMLWRAGLPAVRFHDLHHTCATLLLRQGINPKYVQELLGHADISLTLNVYSHVLPPTWGTQPRMPWTQPWGSYRPRWCRSGVKRVLVQYRGPIVLS